MPEITREELVEKLAQMAGVSEELEIPNIRIYVNVDEKRDWFSKN